MGCTPSASCVLCYTVLVMASSVNKTKGGKAAPRKRGPEPRYLKLEGNWEDRVRDSLRAKPAKNNGKKRG